jgi:hypothetical protein
MNRPEPMDLGQVTGASSTGLPSPLADAWECPVCYLVVWEAGGTARCRRCGFWDTAS